MSKSDGRRGLFMGRGRTGREKQTNKQTKRLFLSSEKRFV